MSSTLASLLTSVCALSTVLLCATGCPPPVPGEGEGEGEGEGDAGGEGEGEGEGDVVNQGTLVVAGANLNLEDVNRGGTELAYRDAADSLFVLSPDGGDPAQVALSSTSDRAEYHGNFLLSLHGPDANEKVFDIAEKVDGATVTALPNNLKVKSLDASPDGAHLYFETQSASQATLGLEDLHLDDTVILQTASKEKTRFTPDSGFLVVAADDDDGSGGTVAKFVKSFPIADVANPITLLAANASNENLLTRDGTQLVMGANEQSNVVDIVIKNVDGTGALVTLKSGGDDAKFKMTVDDSEVVYLTDTSQAGGGDIESVTRDGVTRHTIKSGGAVDLASISLTHVVYASTVDALSGLADLRIVALDGSGDTALGSNAIDDGFTSDDRFYLFRDGVIDNGVTASGTLKSFDTTNGTLATLATDVDKVAKLSATKVAFIDVNGDLKVVTLGGSAVTLGSAVDHFAAIPSGLGLDATRVAYSTSTDGIYVVDVP